MNTVKIPIHSNMASKLVSEHTNLEGVIESISTTTVFYDNGKPVLEMQKSTVNGQELVSYFAFLNELKGD